MNTSNEVLDAIAMSVRMLSADATREANSGHPGLPLGLAELGALLFAEVMKYNPKNPKWEDRDRLVLSAGHGSMWQYSLLHLSGYALSLAQLKKFRQLGSKTPGHPEYGHTVGIETTTGPLGAGFANSVGMAIAERMLADKFNKSAKVVDHYTYAVAGDGCMMEGITSEAASLAGHLELGKLIVFYDSNSISIEGSTDLAFTENVAARFKAYKWQVLNSNAHDYDSLRRSIAEAKQDTTHPTVIICKSIIGKGAPESQGTAKVHGAPLAADEIERMKEKMGVDPKVKFYIHPEATNYFASQLERRANKENEWNEMIDSLKKEDPDLGKEWDSFMQSKTGSIKWPKYKEGDVLATRKANGACIQAISETVDFFTGGSADLEPSNNTKMPSKQSFFASSPQGRMLHYGVREHAMGAIVNGITLHGGLRAFGATFLVFADYMRPALRLAAIMRIPSIFVFTHDSIFVGEDGPTHQPVEHAPSLRLIPHLRVFRPADAQESVIAWKIALTKKKDPNALLFTRQNLEVFQKPKGWEKDAMKGAYVIQAQKKADVTFVATGSEVSVALDAAKELLVQGKKAQVVSMLCKELYDEQDKQWKEGIIPKNSQVVICEAATPMGWDSLRPIGHIGIEGFGVCGPANEVKVYFGLEGKSVAKKVMSLL